MKLRSQNMPGRYISSALPAIALTLGMLMTHSAAANDLNSPDAWHGEWMAEGTPFSLRVIPAGSRFTVLPVSPQGIEWQASNGVISGNSGTIEVSYQGVNAQVFVQLMSADQAIARSLSCQPDYHVICTLVRNQQALFVRKPAAIGE